MSVSGEDGKRRGEEGKRRGMSDVDAGADYEWRLYAGLGLLAVARVQPFLTADDVAHRIPPQFDTRDWRAMGPVFQRAAAAGIIVKADTMGVNSDRASKHAGPMTVWRSLIYKGPPLLRFFKRPA